MKDRSICHLQLLKKPLSKVYTFEHDTMERTAHDFPVCDDCWKLKMDPEFTYVLMTML